jgi:protein-S-isoprenylcysteine O-methyltransferase Ste14
LPRGARTLWSMPDAELPYRIAVGGAWIIGYAIRLYHERQARDVPRVSGRHVTRDRVFYWMVFAAFMLALLYAFSPFLDVAHLPIPAPIRWVGLLFAVIGIALLHATHRALGRNWSGKLEIAQGHQLIVAGPYRRVRHPMYTALFCTAFAFALLSANWIVAVANVGAVAAMYLARVADEEQMLIDQFGDEYRAYVRRTGRLLPKLQG